MSIGKFEIPFNKSNKTLLLVPTRNGARKEGTTGTEKSMTPNSPNRRRILGLDRSNSLPSVRRRLPKSLKQCRDTQACLFGREVEWEKLDAAYEASCRPLASTQIVILEGDSGTGKTHLLRHFLKQKDKECWIGTGKFDQYQSLTPYSAISDALTELKTTILQRELEAGDIRDDALATNRLKQEMSVGQRRLFSRLFPTWWELLMNENEEQEDEETIDFANVVLGGSNAASNTRVAIKTLIRNLAEPQRPVVLFLDDLQWIDIASQELLHGLLSSDDNDGRMENFLFVGATRDRDIMQAWGSTSIVRVNTLQQQDLYKLICHMLDEDIKESQNITELAQLVMRKTHGNAFHVVRYMEHLEKNNLIVYSTGVQHWEWQLEKIQSRTDVAENVVEMLTDHLDILPSDVKFALVLASCIGFVFDASLLERLMKEYCTNESGTIGSLDHVVLTFTDILEYATNENLIEVVHSVGDVGAVREGHSLLYKFTHDRIQQSLYTTIPEGVDRDRLHFTIGTSILSNGEECKHVFLAADQWNRGAACLTSFQERLSLISINLKAGKLAHSRSAFPPAVIYLRSAAKTIGGGDGEYWTLAYPVALEVHTLLAESLFSCRDFDGVYETVAEILSHAKSHTDKVRAYYVKAKTLGIQNKYIEARTLTVKVLRLLGERIPNNPSPIRLILELVQTMLRVRKMRGTNLLELPHMATNGREKMRFWVMLEIYSSLSFHDGLVFLSYLREMKLTLREGFSESTGSAFSAYGILVTILFEDLKTGCYFGKLGLRAAEQWHDPIAIPRAYLSSYGWVVHYQEPLLSILDHLLVGYRLGVETGDLDYGAICLQLYVSLYVFLGLPTVPFLTDLNRFTNMLRESGQRGPLQYLIAFQKFAITLSEGKETIMPVNSEIAAEDFNPTFQELQLLTAANSLNDLFLYILLGDLEQANIAYKTLMRNYNEAQFSTLFMVYFSKVLMGLLGLSNYFVTKQRRHLRLAHQSLRLFKRLAKKGAVNSLGMLLLLNAEFESIKPNTSSVNVRKMYIKAITSLTRGGFTALAALANERAAQAMERMDDNYWVVHFIEASLERFSEWGAICKIRQMKEKYRDVLTGCQKRQSSSDVFVVYGRERFEDVHNPEAAYKDEFHSSRSLQTLSSG